MTMVYYYSDHVHVKKSTVKVYLYFITLISDSISELSLHFSFVAIIATTLFADRLCVDYMLLLNEGVCVYYHFAVSLINQFLNPLLH